MRNKKNGQFSNTHGMTETRIFNTWSCMLYRCKHTDKFPAYKNISVDKRWEKFENFYEDMKKGYKENLTLDRINNKGNYCKENCRWATMKQQARNTRRNHFVKGKTISEWSEITGLGIATILWRLKKGWSIENTLTIKPSCANRISYGKLVSAI
jgi:hypothetical protein